MRYRFRYNIGPMYADGPFGGGPSAAGVLAQVLRVAWYVMAFILQLVVWAVLLVVGIVYTIGWIIVWPFHRVLARPTGPRL
jgi:hypothetical protein